MSKLTCTNTHGPRGAKCRSARPALPGLAICWQRLVNGCPAGMNSAADLPKITQALLDRGYSADDIRKILGGNLLRVFGEVERISAKMQSVKADAH